MAGKAAVYISNPNAVVFCVDKHEDFLISGRFYTNYSFDGCVVRNLNELFVNMNRFFDEVAFPFETTTFRVFKNGESKHAEKRERVKVMNDKELLNKHGDIGSFLINVQHRQNSSWQGNITWLEKSETINFRSVWELAHLINSALEIATDSKNDVPEWREAQEENDVQEEK